MYLETGIRLWRWANAVSCVGVLQFVGLSALATSFYPGGTPVDHGTAGYSFFENHLSDLGLRSSWSGESNTVSCWLFNGSVVVLAVSIVPFFLFLPTHAPDRTGILWIAAVFGIGSSIALVVIGLTPYDLHFLAHHLALFYWMVLLLVAVILHFCALWSSEECSGVFALLSLALAAVLAAYMICGMDLLAGQILGSSAESLVRSAAMQKWVVLTALGWYLVFGVRMVCTTGRDLRRAR
ncbi:MAG: hypothetical protein ACYTG0_24010 [Planctomycetota bacterium]|jgi:hypothetical membrane protein